MVFTVSLTARGQSPQLIGEHILGLTRMIAKSDQPEKWAGKKKSKCFLKIKVSVLKDE